jgi:hypothetical protein
MSYLSQLQPSGFQALKAPVYSGGNAQAALARQAMANQSAIVSQSRDINARSYMADRQSESIRQREAVKSLTSILEKNPNVPVSKGLSETLSPTEVAALGGAQGVGVEHQAHRKNMNAFTGKIVDKIEGFETGKAVADHKGNLLGTYAPREAIAQWLESDEGKKAKNDKFFWDQVKSAGNMVGNDPMPQPNSVGMSMLQERYLESQQFDLSGELKNYSLDLQAKQNDRHQMLASLIRAGYGPTRTSSAGPSAYASSGAIEDKARQPVDPNSAAMPAGNFNRNEPRTEKGGLPATGSFVGAGIIPTMRAGHMLSQTSGGFRSAKQAAHRKAMEGISTRLADIDKGGIMPESKNFAKFNNALQKSNINTLKGKKQFLTEIADLNKLQGKILSANGIDFKGIADNPKKMSALLQKSIADGSITKIPKGVDVAANKALKKGIIGAAAKKAGVSLVTSSVGGPLGWILGTASTVWTAWEVYNLLKPSETGN